MKKLTITLLSLSSALWSGSISPERINKMIAEIKEERIGIKLKKLETTVNPFVIVEIKKEEENLTKEKPVEIKEIIVETVYRLEAILNHSAFINKKWYKKGAKIELYTVAYIGKKSVTLQGPEGNKILSLKKKTYIKLH